MKPTWLLAFKIFIVLFWITMLFSLIRDLLFGNYKLEYILEDIDLDLFLLCSPLSILFEKFYKKRSLIVTYFLCFSLYMVSYASFSFFTQYISDLKYNIHFTHWYELAFYQETLHISLSFVLMGFGLYGLISYFQNNYQKAILCFIIFFFGFDSLCSYRRSDILLLKQKIVKDKKELIALWERLTKNFKKEYIETNEKGTRITRFLDDDTAISLRDYSSKTSENTPTIDTKIEGKNYKIHIDKGM